jgi:hypothetical protein
VPRHQDWPRFAVAAAVFRAVRMLQQLLVQIVAEASMTASAVLCSATK